MTMKQIQNLLQYLGFYDGIPDGIYGPKTYQATLDFQVAYGDLEHDGKPGMHTQKALLNAVANGMPECIEEPESDMEFWSTIKYWTRNEFKCRCGEYHAPYCNGFPVEPDKQLVRLADQVREHFGRPGHRSSGIRCVQHNADSDGVANSRHLSGKALDFRIEDHTSAQVLAYVKALPGVRYAYAIDGTFVHMDVE